MPLILKVAILIRFYASCNGRHHHFDRAWHSSLPCDAGVSRKRTADIDAFLDLTCLVSADIAFIDAGTDASSLRHGITPFRLSYRENAPSS
jgi:hypothetical protein